MITDNATEIQRRLDIAAHISQTWKLDFNNDKSKVLIIGKRTDSSKLCKCVVPNCVGVHISRSLCEHTHVNEIVKKGNTLKIGGWSLEPAWFSDSTRSSDHARAAHSAGRDRVEDKGTIRWCRTLMSRILMRHDTSAR